VSRMKRYDDSRHDRPGATQEYGQVQRVHAPGKVTRPSKLPGGHALAVQRRAAVPVAPARASAVLCSDLYLDMAHRGLTALPMPVQARGSIAADPAAVHRAASAGVSEAGGSLPYADWIQVSFGPAHDAGSVQAHVGGAAAEASERIDAEAYAAARFEEILDGFAAGTSELGSGHKGQLDSVAARLKAKAALKVRLGGAADLAEPRPDEVSLARATAAKRYLTSKGIDAARIQVQSYGAGWARVKTAAGKDEPRNRRVQVWVR
jgi:outer membrane protein OmpA-like peptidoglycan-associated protein